MKTSLARFVVEIMEELVTRAIEQAYGSGGSPPYPPKMMLALLFYCYAKGIFSTRKIEQATYEQIPVLFITGATHPDHDSINTLRKRFLGGVIIRLVCETVTDSSWHGHIKAG